MIRFQSDYPFGCHWSVSEDVSEHVRRVLQIPTVHRRLLGREQSAGTRSSSSRTASIPQELKVIKPVNRFNKEGDATWVWTFDNLEPTLADDFEIEARPKTETYYRPIAGEVTRTDADTSSGGEQWTMAHSNYRVKASSTLPPEGRHKYDRREHPAAWSEACGAKAPRARASANGWSWFPKCQTARCHQHLAGVLRESDALVRGQRAAEESARRTERRASLHSARSGLDGGVRVPGFRLQEAGEEDPPDLRGSLAGQPFRGSLRHQRPSPCPSRQETEACILRR